MVEAGIRARQAERTFPVDPSAHGLSGLTVGQAFHVLPHSGQSKPSWCFGGLATARKQVSGLLINPRRTNSPPVSILGLGQRAQISTASADTIVEFVDSHQSLLWRLLLSCAEQSSISGR